MPPGNLSPEPSEPRKTAGEPDAEKRLLWAVRTVSKQYLGPLTQTLLTVTNQQDVDISFELDLGPNPQPEYGMSDDLQKCLTDRRYLLERICYLD